MGPEDFAGLSPEVPATLLWCSNRECACGQPEERRDFKRLGDALAFVVSEMPLGRRITAWMISGNRLLPPERVAELSMTMAA